MVVISLPGALACLLIGCVAPLARSQTYSPPTTPDLYEFAGDAADMLLCLKKHGAPLDWNRIKLVQSLVSGRSSSAIALDDLQASRVRLMVKVRNGVGYVQASSAKVDDFTIYAQTMHNDTRTDPVHGAQLVYQSKNTSNEVHFERGGYLFTSNCRRSLPRGACALFLALLGERGMILLFLIVSILGCSLRCCTMRRVTWRMSISSPTLLRECLAPNGCLAI